MRSAVVWKTHRARRTASGMTHTLHAQARAPFARRHASEDDGSPPNGLQSNKAGNTTYKDWEKITQKHNTNAHTNWQIQIVLKKQYA